ncbi:flagellar assembly protein FliW [Robertmurraya sp. Marseille-Q9965]
MKIETKYHGEVDINEKDLIQFKNGIPGFPKYTKYIIIPLGEQSPFSVLQSVDTTDLAFVIADPFPFYKDYEFDMEEHVIKQLEIQKEEDVQVYNVVTLGEKIETSTVNLQAPLIVNKRNNCGKQLVLNTEKYHTKHVLHKIVIQTSREGS